MKATGDAVNHPCRGVSFAGVALVLAMPLTGCGDYDPPAREAAAGSSGQTTVTGQLGGAGQTAAGGSSSAGGTGGSSGMGGSGGGAIEVAPVEASCEAVEPCGGSVVGTWVVAGSCLPVSGNADIAGFGLGCTAAPVSGTLEVAGTWAANADGTFTDQTTTTGDSLIELPAECLNVSGTITTCDRLGGALQALGYAAVTCENAASGGGCACAASIDQAGGLAILALGAASSGTYTAASDVLTTSAAGTNNTYSYCASGNSLLLTPQAPGTTGTLTGTVVLVKP
jgi:hypothetical protein